MLFVMKYVHTINLNQTPILRLGPHMEPTVNWFKYNHYKILKLIKRLLAKTGAKLWLVKINIVCIHCDFKNENKIILI